MILSINSDYPEIPEQYSSEIHALIFTLMDLIRRAYAVKGAHQDDPERAIEAAIKWARDRYPEIPGKSPEELAQILRQRGLIITKR